MPFLELTLRCSEAEQPRYEAALDDVGALAVTMLDADADTSNEHAILEPGVGEIPLWQSMVLSALFPHDADALVLLAALESFDPGLEWTQVRFRQVEDQDWERAWMDQYVPLQFGRRTWIVPWNHDLPDGAAHAVGVDNDPQALLATDDNAQRNGVAERIQVHLPQDEPLAQYPVVVANILASALIALADTLAARVAPGGRIALSGILAGQEDEVLARYAADFEQLRADRLEDWMRVTGVRRR